MQNQRGFIGVGILIAIILGVVVLGGGTYFVVHQQSSLQDSPLGTSLKEYNDEKLGISFKYPSDARLTTSTLSGTTAISIGATSTGAVWIFPYIKSAVAAKNDVAQLDNYLAAISKDPELYKKNTVGTKIISKATIPGFTGIRGVVPLKEIGDVGYNLYKKLDDGSYLLINAAIPGLVDFNRDTTLAEKMFAEILSTISISSSNQANTSQSNNVGNIQPKNTATKPDTSTKTKSADTNITGFQTTSVESEQSTFAAIAVGTPLQGHVLVPADEYIFTDGKEGIDTVGYKKSRSSYTIYKGSDVPSKGYYNTIIVTGNDHYFIEVDVNSELIQFLDQKLSIPDLKVVSAAPATPQITFGASTDGKNFLQDINVTKGTSVTLMWLVSSASNCLMYMGGILGQKVPIEARAVESPTVTTSYRISCVNNLGNGGEASAEKTVTVSVQ